MKRFPLRQFLRYEAVAVLSTAADWGSFWLCAVRAHFHYLVALAVSIFCATLVHYTLNKYFTFRCTSRQYARQLAAHALMSLIYLLISMGVMYLLVEGLRLSKMQGRVVTTLLLMFLSFAMHKYVTFNKRLFAQA